MARNRIVSIVGAVLTVALPSCGRIASEASPPIAQDGSMGPSAPSASPTLPPAPVACGIEAIDVSTLKPSAWHPCGANCESTDAGTIIDHGVAVVLRSRVEADYLTFVVELLDTGQPIVAARTLSVCGATPAFGPLGFALAYWSPVVPIGPRAQESKRYVSLLRASAPTKVETYEVPPAPLPTNEAASSLHASCINMHVPLVTADSLLALRCEPETMATYARPLLIPGAAPLDELGPYRRIVTVRTQELFVEDDKSLARVLPGVHTVEVVPNAPSQVRAYTFDTVTDTLVWTERPKACAGSTTTRTLRAIQFPTALEWKTIATIEGSCDDQVDDVIAAGGGYVAMDALSPIVIRRSDGAKLSAKFEVPSRGGVSIEQVVHVDGKWLVTGNAQELKRRPVGSLAPLP